MKPNIPISDFTYKLTDDRIAKFPLSTRDSSKLLLYRKGNISESEFYKLSEYLPANSLLVFNNTKVIHARLLFQKDSGARIEVFCLEPIMPHTAEQALASHGSCEWLCTVGNLKRWKLEALTMPYSIKGQEGVLRVEKKQQAGASVNVLFSWTSQHSFGELMEACGQLPIPPYLNRATEADDEVRYQTVYAKHEGSVAAPTAGLHFTERVFQSLVECGAECEELTLHVGAGTFKPVKSETIDEHEMHNERFSVKRGALEHIIQKLETGKLIAVGTTSVRTLESLYYLGVQVMDNPNAEPEQLSVSQWQPYEREYSIAATDALDALLGYMDKRKMDELSSSTSIMIVPKYRFKLISGLVTNFHQPQSTLLLLIAALIGNDWHRVYDYALAHDFRFLSYGDSSLLLP